MLNSRYATPPMILLMMVGAAACSVDATDDSSQAGEMLENGATLSANAARGAFSNTYSITFEYTSTVFLACAPGAPGEFVFLQGLFEGHVHEAIDAQGAYHFNIQYRPTNVAGTGETSGTLYRLRGAANDQFSGEGAGEFSFTNDFRLVGAGPNNDAILHLPSHFGVSDSGVLDPSVFGGTFECQ